jgi:hypothetical protein
MKIGVCTPGGRAIVRGLALVAATIAGAGSTVVAQRAVQPQEGSPPGWVFTPAIGVAATTDNNVSLASEGSDSASDQVGVLSPSAALGYRGRFSTFHLDYRGSYRFYQELSQLNGLEQHLNVSGRHRASRSVTLFAQNSTDRSPTTDELVLTGVRFRRQGVVLDDARAGMEAAISPRTTVNAAYTFQWINFENLQPIDALRDGGHAHGVIASLEHALTGHLSIGGEYEGRRASVEGPSPDFSMQDALMTVGVQLAKHLELSGGAGYSWLSAREIGETRSAPALRASLTGSGARYGWNVAYRRSFLPSFGFGGTFQNQELEGGVFGPIGRRFEWSTQVALRENDPLQADVPGLVSVWTRGSLGFLATRWMRVQGFYTYAFQDSQRPGGRVDRTRIGFQVVTSKRMRLR